jgi:hypothetical protein
MLLIINNRIPNTLASKRYGKPSGELSESILLPRQVLKNPFNLYPQRNRVIDAIQADLV